MAYEKKNALAVLKNMNLLMLTPQEYEKLTQLLSAYGKDYQQTNVVGKNNALLQAQHAPFWGVLERKFGLQGVDPQTNDNALKNRVLMLYGLVCNPENINPLSGSINKENVNQQKKQYVAQNLLRGIMMGTLKRDGTKGDADRLTDEQFEQVITATNRQALLQAFGFTLETPEQGQHLHHDNIIPPASLVHIRQFALQRRLLDYPALLEVFQAIRPSMEGITGQQVRFLVEHPNIAKAFEHFNPPISTPDAFLRIYAVFSDPANQLLVEKLAQSVPALTTPQLFLDRIADLNNKPVLKAMIERYDIASRPVKDIQQVIVQLVCATTVNEVMTVTGSYTDVNQLLRENAHFQLLDKIQNPAIRDVLKGIKLKPVTEDNIHEINQLILNTRIALDDPLGGYKNLIMGIRANVDLQDNVSGDTFYNAFNLGFPVDGYQDVNNHPVADRICAQQQYKFRVHPVLSILSRFRQAHQLNNIGQKHLLEIIKAAKDFNAFKEVLKDGDTAFGKKFKCKAEGIHGGVDQTFKAIFPDCETVLTEMIFWELKTAYNSSLLKPEERERLLKTEHQTLQKKIKDLNRLYQGIKPHIDILKDANQYTLFHLFNPQHAKDNAHAFRNMHFIAKNCDVMIKEYQYHLKQLDYLLKSMPPPINPLPLDRKARKIEEAHQKMRNALEEQIVQLKEQCADLEGFSTLYHGDNGFHGDENHIKKIGLKGKIKKAQNNANKMRILHKDNPNETVIVRKPKTEDERKVIFKPLSSSQDQNRKKAYQFPENVGQEFKTVDILKPGEFLECTRRYPPQQAGQADQYGRFVLERDNVDVGTKHKNLREDAMRVKVIEFPENEVDRIDLAVNMVSKMIASLGSRVPTKDNPIHVLGYDLDQIRYIVTALLLMGQRNENFKFSMDAIKIHNDAFSLSSEYGVIAKKGFKRDFKENSLYVEQREAFDQRINQELQGVQEFQRQSFGGDYQAAMKQKNKVVNSTVALNKQFKEKVKDGRSKIEEIENEQMHRLDPG